MIEYDGVACGYVCIEDRADDIHVREIDIDPSFQGLGIGTAVIRSAIERAQTRRVPVLLGTLHQNHAAELYRRLGFTETGQTGTHILFRLDPIAAGSGEQADIPSRTQRTPSRCRSVS